MPSLVLDTDVVIRLLTGDDPRKQAEAEELFRRADRGDIVLIAPDTMIADAIHVLSSPRIYGLPRQQVAQMLRAVLAFRGLRVMNEPLVREALDVFAASTVDFGDAMIAALASSQSLPVVSYDRDFDRLSGVTRREPPDA